MVDVIAWFYIIYHIAMNPIKQTSPVYKFGPVLALPENDLVQLQHDSFSITKNVKHPNKVIMTFIFPYVQHYPMEKAKWKKTKNNATGTKDKFA